LNALALAADGTLYVSDSGIKEGFESTGSDAIYRIRGEREVERLASGPSLGHPSGLHAANGGVWAVGFTSGELYFVGADGKQANVRKLPSGQLDVIVELDDAQLAIASWEGRCVYRGPAAGGEFTKVVGDTDSAAGIGYDKKRERLLLPLVLSDALEAHSLPPPTPGP
jgi:sugar lactone lactonase YvrE